RERRRAGPTVHREASPVLVHDAVGDREPEPGALSDLFRRVERLEDVSERVGGDSGTVVDHLRHDGGRRRAEPRAHDDLAGTTRAENRLLRIEKEIQEYLLELGRVGGDRG